MLAILSNLPKWLLAVVAVCVFAGYAEQVECKTVGCKPPMAAADADTVKKSGESAPSDGGEDSCHCQCHLTTLAFGEAPAFQVGFIGVVAAQLPAWVDRVPEAPCADIEHPPQLA